MRPSLTTEPMTPPGSPQLCLLSSVVSQLLPSLYPPNFYSSFKAHHQTFVLQEAPLRTLCSLPPLTPVTSPHPPTPQLSVQSAWHPSYILAWQSPYYSESCLRAPLPLPGDADKCLCSSGTTPGRVHLRRAKSQHPPAIKGSRPSVFLTGGFPVPLV